MLEAPETAGLRDGCSRAIHLEQRIFRGTHRAPCRWGHAERAAELPEVRRGPHRREAARVRRRQRPGLRNHARQALPAQGGSIGMLHAVVAMVILD